MWDYDKLFAEGNIAGLKNKQQNRIFPSSIDGKKYWGREGYVDWSEYCNNSLSTLEDESGGYCFEIQYIIRLDEHGNVVEKLFDREFDMPKPMPELETGMFVLIFNYDHTETRLGYINAEKNMIIYQSGGWDYIDRNEDEILKVYSNNCNCFNGCIEHRVIWRNPEYQAYFDSKSN